MVLGEVTDYTIQIVARGGGAPVGTLDPSIISQISWGRKLDAYSDAQVELFLDDGCNCDILGVIDPIAHELHILRDGVVVWLGPITYVEYGRSTGFIQARDLSTWLLWRVVHQDFVKENRILVDYATGLALDALNPDNPNITVVGLDAAAEGEREAFASDYLVSLDEIEEVLRTDVDMTVVGRTIYFYGTEVEQRLLPQLNDEHFLDDVRISRSGLAMANRVIVNGDGSKWGVWPPDGEEGSARYGLKERVFNETGILDDESLIQAAKTRYDILSVPYTVIDSPSGARLSPECPFGINDLIPGFRQRIVLTELCSAVSGLFRISEVSVDVSSAGESVKVSWQTLGSLEKYNANN